MVANSLDAQRNRFTRELQAARLRQAAVIARDYTPVLTRLTDAYNNILSNITPPIVALGQGEITNAAVNRLKDTLTQELATLTPTITTEATQLETAGVTNGVRLGVANVRAGGMSTQFSQGTLNTIRAGINFVDSPAFQSATSNYAPYHADVVGDLILRALAQGKNPRDTARLALAYFTDSKTPLRDAERLTRTTQIYSMRTGTNELYKSVGVDEWIWSAAIGDPRTCLSCVAMHGTVHPVSEVLNDHHLGRCAAVPKTPTWQQLGFTGGGEPTFETGVTWFNRQEQSAQRQLLGVQLFQAFQQGKFTFSPDAVVGTYENPIFNVMRRRKTNAEILGG